MEFVNPSTQESTLSTPSFVEQTAVWCKDTACSVVKTSFLFLKSPLLWTFGSLIGSAAIISPLTTVCLLGGVCGAMVRWPEHIPRALLYEGAMVDNRVSDLLTRLNLVSRPYCSHIIDGVYLSGLPIKNFVDYSKCNPKAVLAVVEEFELTTETFFSAPMTQTDWQKLGVFNYNCIPVEDLTAISIQHLDQAADFINTHKEGVIVHCKAGRGRSAMSVIAYLMKHKHYDLEKATDTVKEKRPHISIKPWQMDSLKTYENSLKTPPIEC